MNESKQSFETDLSVNLGSVQMANPVITASGTCGYAFELADFVDLTQIGGFITKSITLNPRPGNPPQRAVETASGMLNSIGLANVGLDRFITEKVPLLEKMPIPVFVNVAGKTIDEYIQVSRRLSEIPTIRGLELNVSCPNVQVGGITFGIDACATAKLVGEIRKICPQSLLIVKLTPNVTDITKPARAAVDAGADALSLVNTFTGMAINIENCKPVLGNITGGLSGPAIKPLAVYLTHKVYREVAQKHKIPIIGMGGIANPADAIEFLIAGASAVSVGTAAMINPSCLTNIATGIKEYLVGHNIKSITELTGSLQI
ncbi:MAG: dihydroorotate dehydrogenase [Planctomycetes bacterium]|nr:dihydroorotate dehydrogenase [Planctomycetota bacterium]